MPLVTQEHTLPNGLKIITREVHTAPIATCWVWYRVGGRNERVGISGISHWCEHMLFKGTPSMPKGTFDSLIARNGGTFNGFTWIDFTAYYETLPADRLDLGLRIEADRMVNSLFDPDEVASERTVIISEREGNENSPDFWLDEEMRAAAFKVHPYRNGVIGWKSDLRAMTRADLYNHYQTYYTPNNATLVVVGDFNTDQVLERIGELYGSIPAGPALPEVRGVEPEQQGERRIIVARPGANPIVQVAYHAVAARSQDWAALTVLDAVLSGGKSPSFFGGGAQTNRSARLYRALVEGELATSASSSFLPTIDPYLFELSATVRPDRDVAAVEAALHAETERLRSTEVSAEELAKVQRQMRAQFAYTAERISSQAMLLGMWEMLDSYTRIDSILAEIAAVTPADVQRVASEYLAPHKRTVGIFQPTEAGGAADTPALAAYQPRRPACYTGASFSADALSEPVGSVQASRHELPNGVVVLIQRNPASPTVTVQGEIRLGQVDEPADKSGLALFTAAGLIRGTLNRSFQEITATTEERGCSVNASSSRHTTSFGGKALSEDTGLILEILADMVRRPVFPPQEIERLRTQFINALRQQAQDTRSQAANTARTLLYPNTHPYSRPTLGTLETVPQITQADLRGFAQRYHPASTTIAIVGDLEPDAVLAEVERWFGDWEGSGAPTPLDVPAVAPPAEVKRQAVEVAGKTQSDIIWAVPGIARTDPDYYAAMLANLALGQLGLMGRLGENVRDKHGMAYYATSRLDADLGAGPWYVSAGINPSNIDRALECINEEIDKLVEAGITEEERSDAVAYLSGIQAIGLEANSGIASILLTIERYNLGLDYVQRYPEIISAISLEQIRDAARRFLSTDHYAVAIAGPKV